MIESKIQTIRVPNPFSEGRNRVYVIPSDPLTIVDTGTATDKAYDALVEGLRELGISVRDVRRIILTHKHIDHIGNAWRIQRESGAEILIHESEMHALSDVDPDGRRFQELVREKMVDWMVSDDVISGLEEFAGLKWKIESAEPHGLYHGQKIDFDGGQLEVVHTPGHTKGSICLRLGGLFFSGDHVLPDISPNIGGGDMRHRGLLNDYLQSLQHTLDLATQIDQVFPGHGDPFSHLHSRCLELIAHHHQRLEQAANILEREGPMSIYKMAQALFGELHGFHLILGCAEAHAHLDVLVDQARVLCVDGQYSCQRDSGKRKSQLS
jgi:hydroxyacylglutathione hydrolase